MVFALESTRLAFRLSWRLEELPNHSFPNNFNLIGASKLTSYSQGHYRYETSTREQNSDFSEQQHWCSTFSISQTITWRQFFAQLLSKGTRERLPTSAAGTTKQLWADSLKDTSYLQEWKADLDHQRVAPWAQGTAVVADACNPCLHLP